jgi:hypothetical protein
MRSIVRCNPGEGLKPTLDRTPLTPTLSPREREPTVVVAAPELYTSSVTVTGTWSDGRCQPRASRVILKSRMPSLSARDTQM